MSVEASRLSVFAPSRLPAAPLGKPAEDASDFASMFASETAPGKPVDRPTDRSPPKDNAPVEKQERPVCAAHHGAERRAEELEQNGADPTGTDGAGADKPHLADTGGVEEHTSDCMASGVEEAPVETVGAEALPAPLSDGSIIAPTVAAAEAPAAETAIMPVLTEGKPGVLPSESLEIAAVQAATVVSATALPVQAQPTDDAAAAMVALAAAAQAPTGKSEALVEGEAVSEEPAPEEGVLPASLVASDKPAADAKAVQAQTQSRSAEPSSPAAPLVTEAAKTVASAPAVPILLPQPRAQQAAEAVATLRALPIEIGMSALKGMKQFTIRLDPAELGKVEVKLSMDDEGKVQAKLTVDRVDTLYLLQRDARTLERAFDQAGLKTSPDSLAFNLRDSGQGQREQGRQEAAGFERRFGSDQSDEPLNDSRLMRADITHIRQIASAARGGVDLAI
jgi:flagellar hook-length control protein FliK